MAALALALAHPVVPFAWQAISSPAVQDAVAGLLKAERGPATDRQLQDLIVDDSDLGDFAWASSLGMACGIFFWWVIAAAIYRSNVTIWRPQFPERALPELSLSDGKDFKYGLYDCCGDCHYCLYGWCCSAVRAGDTFQAVGASGFWCVVCIMILPWLLAQTLTVAITENALRASELQGSVGFAVDSATLIFVSLWLASKRRKLRGRLGDAQPGGKYLCDCAAYLFCTWCTVIQDARQVDEAEGIRVECCCHLVKTVPPAALQPPPLPRDAIVVGQVVAVVG